jgi:histidinol-phosphate aminotransferase
VLAVRPYVPPLERRRGKLRLDFNENTLGCPPAVLRALRRIDRETVATYPEYAPLRAALARFLGVPRAWVFPASGVDDALRCLVAAFIGPGDVVVAPVPSFVMYRVYAEAAGAEFRAVPLGEDFSFPEARVRRAMRGAKLLFLASPNNPDGSVVPPAVVRRLLEANRRCLVVVDEAYFEFCGVTVLPLLRRHPNLVVLRTFSKAYGMAGLRLGCAAARPEVVALLARVQSPYSVNALAAEVAPVAIRDRGFVRRYVAGVLRARELLRRGLERRGFRTWPSAANFVLVRLGPQARAIEAGLRARGILIRDQGGQPGLEGCVRVGAGTREQAARFLAALDLETRRLARRRPR